MVSRHSTSPTCPCTKCRASFARLRSRLRPGVVPVNDAWMLVAWAEEPSHLETGAAELVAQAARPGTPTGTRKRCLEAVRILIRRRLRAAARALAWEPKAFSDAHVLGISGVEILKTDRYTPGTWTGD